MHTRRAAPMLLALLLPLASVAAPKPRLGFAVEVETDGFFSTTLATVKVASVRADSPSQKAGLKAGDRIVELNGTPIRGASGPALKKTLADVAPGQHVVLKVLHADGRPAVVDIVAGG